MSWKNKIEQAKIHGKFDTIAKYKAHFWQTCAVGEALNLSPYDDDEAFDKVKDAGLLETGELFMRAVQEHRIKEAERLYQKIQEVIS